MRPVVTVSYPGTPLQRREAKRAGNRTSKRATNCLTPIEEMVPIQNDVSRLKKSRAICMVVSRCATESIVLVDKSMVEEFNILKTDLEAERKITRYMKSSGRL